MLRYSMPLRVLIVDDEPLARQELEYLLSTADDLELVASGRNGIEAVDLIVEHRPDVLFLDVQMPGLDGFGVLKKLLANNIAMPQVVFATAYDQYAVRAFEVNAVDYLLKPFDRARVEQTVAKARARMPAQQPSIPGDALDGGAAAKLDALLRLVGGQAQAGPRSAPGKIVVRAGSRLLLVDQKDICFATVDEGTITITTAAVEGHANVRTLEELSEQLDPEMFWRAHRSYLVNLQHIREVVPWFKASYQLRMDDPRKTEIPVSRNQTRRLRELFKL